MEKAMRKLSDAILKLVAENDRKKREEEQAVKRLTQYEMSRQYKLDDEDME